MINTKRPNTNDYTQVGFIEAKDTQGNYQNIDHIYDSEGNIVFQQGYLNEYQGADNFSIPAIGKPLIDYTIYGNMVEQSGTTTVSSKNVTVSSLESDTNYALFSKSDFPNAVVGDTINIVVSGTSYSQKVMKIDASYVYIENRTV